MDLLRKVFPGGESERVALPFPDTPISEKSAKLSLQATIPAHEERAWMVAWHPSGDVLASCSSDKTVKLWSRRPDAVGDAEWRCIGTLEGEHERTVRCISWSPDGEALACSSFDATVSIWKKVSPQFDMEVEGILDGHENEVKSVAWSADGQYLATCSRDKTVWIWDRTTGEYECAGVLTGHTQDVKCVRWSRADSVLFSCGYDDTVKVWQETPGRKDDWHCTQTLVKHSSTVWEVTPQPSPATAIIASCSDDASVIFWFPDNTGKYQPARVITGVHERTIFSIDWAPSMTDAVCSTLLACASGDDSISVLEVIPNVDSSDLCPFAVKTLVTEPQAHASDVNCIRCSPVVRGGSMMIATCGDDGVLKVWDIAVAQ